jgi:hypothetical protein
MPLPQSQHVERKPYLHHRTVVVPDLDSHSPGVSGLRLMSRHISDEVGERPGGFLLNPLHGVEFDPFLIGRKLVAVSQVEIIAGHDFNIAHPPASFQISI